MTTHPILTLLLAQLASFSDEMEMTFREDADRSNRFELSVECDEERLLAALAKALGAAAGDVTTGDTVFTISESYESDITFRDFADEMTPRWGEFFEETVTLGDLRALAKG